MTFTDADAQRLLRIVDERIERRLSQTQVRYLWGTVASVDTANRKCSVYLLGDTSASPGFRYGPSMEPGTNYVVRVAISPDGDRWIDQIATGTQINMSNGSVWNGPTLELRSNAGNSFIDFANDAVADYDARIIYGSATGDDYLNVYGKLLRAREGITSDKQITAAWDISGRTLFANRGMKLLTGDASSSGKWGKVASGVFSGQYQVMAAKGSLVSRYHQIDWDLLIRDDNATGGAPSTVSFKRHSHYYSTSPGLVLITTSLSPWPSWEVWCQVGEAWGDVYSFPMYYATSGPSVTFHADDTGYTTLPAGTQYSASAW